THTHTHINSRIIEDCMCLLPFVPQGSPMSSLSLSKIQVIHQTTHTYTFTLTHAHAHAHAHTHTHTHTHTRTRTHTHKMAMLRLCNLQRAPRTFTHTER